MLQPALGSWSRRLPLALACVSLLACSGSPTLAPEGEPYLRGPVESVTRRATTSSILVAAGPGSREPCGISAKADAETRSLRRSGGVLHLAALAELQVGDTVEVYVSGPVAESCPVQGRASAIVLVAPAGR